MATTREQREREQREEGRAARRSGGGCVTARLGQRHVGERWRRRWQRRGTGAALTAGTGVVNHRNRNVEPVRIGSVAELRNVRGTVGVAVVAALLVAAERLHEQVLVFLHGAAELEAASERLRRRALLA